ncbi:peptide chain release factor 1-like, mitochondrial [Limulus polyphemus]|uniref:Peptide chain release factor 1-like, mitochondrial n=1 Tax=Limulus polyphemus TaxID=6850 RepID=A0ABM1T529_LIMPO|nr:peptide chain release factor 1-like, mitochondrial [Limulus polyphemus]XP_022250985.1 peptide chain release factor 1-like, mitochondrial [Limulus polyphemus]
MALLPCSRCFVRKLSIRCQFFRNTGSMCLPTPGYAHLTFQLCKHEKKQITKPKALQYNHLNNHLYRNYNCKIIDLNLCNIQLDSNSKMKHVPRVNNLECFHTNIICATMVPKELSLSHAKVKSYLESIVNEYHVLEEKTRSSVIPQEMQKHLLMLHPLVTLIEEATEKREDLEELEQFLKGLDPNKDVDLIAVAKEDIGILKSKLEDLEEALFEQMIPPEDIDDKDLILEITAGVGGQEAMLFTKEIFDMYYNYATWKGWQCEILDYEVTDLGGLRHAALSIKGLDACKYLKFEGGVHRVQRVPKTEKSGRIHTSTVAVAVLPQPSEVDVVLEPKDLCIETKKSSGAGGQHVNTTDSCVRVTHIPTGVFVECQTDRSQHRNKENALKGLRAKLYEKKLEEQYSQQRRSRKLQVGSSARSEKVRTYNFGQDRISDHRVSENLYNVSTFLEGGEKLDELIQTLQESSRKEIIMEILMSYDQK